ncbi:hypothetical protein DPMN_053467 [Dreissena polymorpha]|uniref:Uncharacterized protein n=1 Tax=Dreissena polymorpha TaxID=45954 RepID=A0A9D4HS81_DREPO|nr:hypothetical protein DPMN_053467 [Dreissena polymorpha]
MSDRKQAPRQLNVRRKQAPRQLNVRRKQAPRQLNVRPKIHEHSLFPCPESRKITSPLYPTSAIYHIGYRQNIKGVGLNEEREEQDPSRRCK